MGQQERQKERLHTPLTESGRSWRAARMVLPETLRLWRRWFVALALDARARFLPVAFLAGCRRDARATMALLALSADEQCIIFSQLCNVLDPGIAVDFSSANHELRALTQALRQQLRAEHEVAAALCRKMGMQSCKELREAKEVVCLEKGLSAADLATLGTLGSQLQALQQLRLNESSAGAAGPDGVQRLAAGLGLGALPAVAC